MSGSDVQQQQGTRINTVENDVAAVKRSRGGSPNQRSKELASPLTPRSTELGNLAQENIETVPENMYPDQGNAPTPVVSSVDMGTRRISASSKIKSKGEETVQQAVDSIGSVDGEVFMNELRLTSSEQEEEGKENHQRQVTVEDDEEGL